MNFVSTALSRQPIDTMLSRTVREYSCDSKTDKPWLRQNVDVVAFGRDFVLFSTHLVDATDEMSQFGPVYRNA